MSKKRLSKDQQRKKKLAERARRQPKEPPSLAYEGNKYKSDKYLPYVHATESGIGQADVIAQRRLTDAHVREAMEGLVRTMQSQVLPPLPEDHSIDYQKGQEADLVAKLIRASWENCFATHDHPGQEALIGILRTLLSSVETFTTPAPGSRGYLSFLEGFLRRTGVTFQVVDPRGAVVTAEPPDDPLVDAGLAWIEEGDLTARREFYLIANELIAEGRHEHVAAIAQMLLGTIPPQPVVAELSAVSLSAQSRQALPAPGT
jgi:hypothetical protein